MRVRIHHTRPEPWPERRKKVSASWMAPLCAIEWFWEWIAYALGNWSFLAVLEYLGSFGVLIAVVFYFAESGDRIKQKHYQAWQVINTAQGKGGSGGRVEALQELNSDGIPLVGVDVNGAFLQGIRLRHAHLLRANFSAADLRDSDLSSSDFLYANLQSANFRLCDLHAANFTSANLSDADLVGANLSNSDFSAADLTNADLRNANLAGIKWSDLTRLKDANILAVKNAPPDFASFAAKHGAIQVDSGPQ